HLCRWRPPVLEIRPGPAPAGVEQDQGRSSRIQDQSQTLFSGRADQRPAVIPLYRQARAAQTVFQLVFIFKLDSRFAVIDQEVKPREEIYSQYAADLRPGGASFA